MLCPSSSALKSGTTPAAYSNHYHSKAGCLIAQWTILKFAYSAREVVEENERLSERSEFMVLWKIFGIFITLCD